MTPELARIETRYRRWSTMLLATYRLPDGAEMPRDIEDHGEAVAVLPFAPERRCALLVQQFRAPAFHAAGEATMLEPPAGRLDEADPEACARREALEELGVRLGPLEPVARVWTMPALSTERAWLFLAPYARADRIAAGGGLAAEQEHITVLERPLAELAAMADAGTLCELKLLTLVQTLRLRRPELFAA
ncbi:NUDIX domain-containing protein [Roseomonas sp. BN140053]|uniref:NUDIX domain-containing protein n=1 Tax=Roseomonas sp. BN140053 TaxID=3391898 RepID=UPI0039ED5E00